MNWQVIKIKTLRWLRRIILYGLYSLVISIVLGFAVLQIPTVQESIIARLTRNFSTVTGFNVTFDSFYLVWYDRLQIEGLKVEDPEKNSMIGIKQLYVNYSITSLLKGNDINVDAVELKGANVNLITIAESDTSRDLNINLFIARINEKYSSGKGGGGRAPKIKIGEIIIDNSSFTYADPKKDSIKTGFDFSHFTVDLKDVQAQNFRVIGDTIEFNLQSLYGRELQSQFEIKQLQTYFRLSQTSMEFLGIHAKAGKSIISDTLIFRYQKQTDLNDFVNKVNITAFLKGTVLHPADLALFAPGSGVLKEPLYLGGKIVGRLKRFSYQNMRVGMGQTVLAGSLMMDGLPAINETFINLSLKEGQIQIRDLQALFPTSIYEQLKPLGKFTVAGNFIGFVNDFVADGKFDTPLGKIESDINLKVDETAAVKTTYRGNLEMINFDLGTYLKDTVNFQSVSLRGDITGRGLTKANADFKLNGKIASIGILGYNYSNIITNARFASQLFNGALSINDPNLKLNAIGSIDFRKKHEEVKIKATLDTLLLKELNFSKEPLFLSSQIDIDSKGLQIDSLFGDMILKESVFQYQDRRIEFDSIHLSSELTGKTRKLSLISSLADLHLEGDYYYSTLFQDVNTLFYEFMLNIRNDKEQLRQYYAEKRKSTQVYDAKLAATLYNINPVIKLLGIDATASKNIEIEGKFSNGLTSILHGYTSLDSIIYEGKTFLATEIEFTGSKIRDSTNVLAMLSILSEKQCLSKTFSTKNLLVEGIWNKDHIDLDLDLDQDGVSNSIRLKTEIDFLKDSTKLKVLPSQINALNRQWNVDQANYINIKGKEIGIHKLKIHHEDQYILLDGYVSDQEDKPISLTVENLNVDIFNALITEKISGVADGEISAKDLYHNPSIQNNILIKDFSVNNFLVGDITGINQWNMDDNRFDVTIHIDLMEQRIVSLKGFYDPNEHKDPLSITATLQKANIKMAEPILKDIFSNMDGTLTGTFSILGTFGAPKINGEGAIENGKLTVNYLKTTYGVTGIFGMTPNQMEFRDIILTDALKNKGRLSGFLAHRNFSKMRINIDAAFKNFQVLNTTAKDNSLFYGQAFATGNLNLFGALANMKISATARSEKNTRIFIPIGGSGNVEKKEFINFANFTNARYTDSVNLVSKKKVEISGISMDLNLDITPDAYTEIIFDIKAGDIIRGRGNGDIRLQLDTKGEFNMFGVVEFTEGAYNFTLFDIINKEFVVKPGSRISWFGDPYQGNMNVTASYRQLASLAPIVSDIEAAKISQVKRKYPVEVQLRLDGLMLSPQINFDITARDLPDNIPVNGKPPVRLKFEFDAFKAKLDEQELKKQVFSLIMLRKLAPLGESISTSGSVAGSVSELFSNQLSYWLSQVDQNLEIDIDIGSLDQEAFNTFQLRLSYSFLNGRLKVTRDGSYGNTTQGTRSDVASAIGDWTIDYLLTPDGKFKVKMFSRSNVNQVSSSLGTQSVYTTGVSLLHTQNFNQVKELLRSGREKRRKELEEQQENSETEEENEKGN